MQKPLIISVTKIDIQLRNAENSVEFFVAKICSFLEIRNFFTHFCKYKKLQIAVNLIIVVFQNIIFFLLIVFINSLAKFRIHSLTAAQ